VSGVDAHTEQRLLWLMFARLVLALVSFGIALGMDALGGSLPEEARRGLYWTVSAAFLATVISAALFSRVRSPGRFAAVQLATDVALVTALVHFSGGRESIFSFLYICVTVYGAMLSDRRGAFGAALLSALGYALVLGVGKTGWVDYGTRPDPAPVPMIAAVWAVHVGAMFLVGALASVLSGELHRAGEALDERTHALRRLRDLHQRTVESLMSGLLTTDPGMRVTSFNPEAERITGFGFGEALGEDVDAVIPGARELLGGADTGLEAEPRPSSRARLPYRRRSGEELFLGMAGSILRDESGRPAGYVLIFQDVTRVVEMERELRRSERLAAVGEMGAKIAHEIRNPLAAISGSIEMLQGGLRAQGDGESVRLMDIVLRETERLNALIDDFLGYARPQAPKLEVVALRPVLDELLQVFEAVRPGGVEVGCRVEGQPRAAADAGQLRQVLWNLCLNAVQAMPGGGRLELAVEPCEAPQEAPEARRHEGEGGDPGPRAPGGRGVEICVRDTGPGMPPEVQERIFEPFFTTKREGTGLGLATVHRIVESHGGSLQVRSRPGETTFRVRLPAAEEGA